MEKLILKINHFVFSWYYKRCGDFFKQWTFIKSVKLLIQNYEHNKELLGAAKKTESFAIQEANRERKLRLDLEMKLIASDEEIYWANKIFATDFKKSNEN